MPVNRINNVVIKPVNWLKPSRSIRTVPDFTDYMYKIEQNIKKCTMSDFDRKIGSTKQFYCQTHKIVLCSICSKECHANCPDVIARETNEIKDCQCSDNNHSEYNEFTFVLAKSKTNEDYENNMEKGGHEIARLWPIQILNLLFETEGTFNQLIPFVQSIINTGSEGTLAKFDATAKFLEEEYNFTFEDWEMPEKFKEL